MTSQQPGPKKKLSLARQIILILAYSQQGKSAGLVCLRSCLFCSKGLALPKKEHMSGELSHEYAQTLNFSFFYGNTLIYCINRDKIRLYHYALAKAEVQYGKYC